jgi:hypothetical protein
MWDTTVLDRQLCRFVIRSEAKGSAVPRIFRGNVFDKAKRDGFAPER